jgi:hypothetical protein
VLTKALETGRLLDTDLVESSALDLIASLLSRAVALREQSSQRKFIERVLQRLEGGQFDGPRLAAWALALRWLNLGRQVRPRIGELIRKATDPHLVRALVLCTKATWSGYGEDCYKGMSSDDPIERKSAYALYGATDKVQFRSCAEDVLLGIDREPDSSVRTLRERVSAEMLAIASAMEF